MSQHGTESGFHGLADMETKGQMVPGLQMTPKMSVIIYDLELWRHYGVGNIEFGEPVFN